MRNILILLIVSVLYIGSAFWVTQGKTFRLDSDYDSNLPIISYVVDVLRSERHFPLWNPYVATGISVLGDPLSGVLYLPYLIPMLVFGVPQGWWMVIGLHAFLAAVFMWIFLTRCHLAGWQGDTFKGKWLAVWGSLLYMGSGAFTARVAAGHIEKVLSYPWYPLFFLVTLQRRQTLRNHGLVGVILGIVLLTGDIYGLFFMVLFYGVVWVIGGIREMKGIGMTIGAFILVGAIKLVPFLTEVAPVIARYGSFEAARGSLHVFWAWIPFIMPFGVMFYDRRPFQTVFGFWYNWYEYYAFIGIPLIFLARFPAVVKRREARILALLLVVGIMYLARGYPYSLFYWIDRSLPIFNWFRAPQRMYEAITSIVVALVVLGATRVRMRQIFLWGMLVVTFLVNGYQMTKSLEKPRTEEAQLVRQLRILDPGEIAVATFACCMQTFLVAEKIRVINYYYGWRPKGDPQFVTASGEGFDFTPLEQTVPTYIIAPKDMQLSQYGYEVWFRDEKNVVWRVSKLS